MLSSVAFAKTFNFDIFTDASEYGQLDSYKAQHLLCTPYNAVCVCGGTTK
jgi:hypothetical protein